MSPGSWVSWTRNGHVRRLVPDSRDGALRGLETELVEVGDASARPEELQRHPHHVMSTAHAPARSQHFGCMGADSPPSLLQRVVVRLLRSVTCSSRWDRYPLRCTGAAGGPRSSRRWRASSSCRWRYPPWCRPTRACRPSTTGRHGSRRRAIGSSLDPAPPRQHPPLCRPRPCPPLPLRPLRRPASRSGQTQLPAPSLSRPGSRPQRHQRHHPRTSSARTVRSS